MWADVHEHPETSGPSANWQVVERLSSPSNFGDDVFGGGFPDEWRWVGVPVIGPGRDRGDEIGHTGERPAAETFVGEFLEPAFDQVHMPSRSVCSAGAGGDGLCRTTIVRSLWVDRASRYCATN